MLRSLIRAGLTESQAHKVINAVLLCLHHIGKGQRMSSDSFARFQGELRAAGKRLRLQAVLTKARLIKKTQNHVAGAYSPEYACRGKLIEQTIDADDLNAEIQQKLKELYQTKQANDATLQWLRKSINHRFENGGYTSLAATLGWPSVTLDRLTPAIVAKALEDKFRKELVQAHRSTNYVILDHGDEGIEAFDASMTGTRELFEKVCEFARQLEGNACTLGDIAELDHGRLKGMIRKAGFKLLVDKHKKDVISRVVQLLKEQDIYCAVDRVAIYSKSIRELESAFVLATGEILLVDISQKESPVNSFPVA